LSDENIEKDRTPSHATDKHSYWPDSA